MPHVAALLRVARRLTLNSPSAEDLVQETMYRAWRGFSQFEAGTNARAWLFRILFNAFHAEGRKRALVVTEVPELAIGPTQQEAAEVRQALDALPVEQRTVLLLAAVEGFTCREIAGILDIPMGTVMSRLSRAREELRGILAPLVKEATR